MNPDNNDSTRLMSDEETSILSSDNSNVLNEKTSPVPPADKSAQAPSKRKITTSDMASAGIGLAVGAAAGATVGVNATPSHKDDNIELKDDGEIDKDAANKNETATEVSPEAGTDSPTDVTDNIDPSSTANTINVEINLTTGAEGQYVVSGPNPAEAAEREPNAVIQDAGRQMHENAQTDVENQVTEVDDVILEESSIPEANVSDSMSFSEAFAAARAQVGPGGCFTWHGQVYGTYYENEWNAMSHEEQHDFQLAALNIEHDSNSHHSDSSEQYASAKPTSVDAEVNHGVSGDDVVYVDPEPVSENEVRILGLGQVEDSSGNTHEAAVFDISGNQAMIIDSDDDNVYDVLQADFNHDNQITEDEVFTNFGEQGLTVDDVKTEYEQQLAVEQQFEDDNIAQDITNTDFDNNVDVSDFA